MSNAVTVVVYLLEPAKHPLGRLCVVTGNEPFLKHEALREVRASRGDNADLAWDVFNGRECEWRDVSDALSSVSLFGGGPKAALVTEADAFVKQHRSQLEDYVDRDHAGSLVLEVKTWSGASRLAKAVAAEGLLIKCGVPDRGAELGAFKRSAKRWLVARAKARHETKLTDSAADALFEQLPPSLGVMDQEIAKLSLLVKPGGVIDPPLVQRHVGGWRARKTWDMIDAMAEGDARSALEQLDRLVLSGEQPIGLLAQISSSLRRFAAATCLIEQAEAASRRPSLRSALEQAGVMKFKLADAERQLRQIGRQRARQLDGWLLDADLALKGHNSAPSRARIELERLIVRLSKQAASPGVSVR